MNTLNNQTVFMTGASRGIGRAIALAGDKVLLPDFYLD